MKKYDRIVLTSNEERYSENKLSNGMRGTIIESGNVDDCWLVHFERTDGGKDNIDVLVFEDDMEVIVFKGRELREYDRIELIVDKECYSERGVYKGMRGTILDPRNISGSWLVYFEQTHLGKDDIDIAVNEDDIKLAYLISKEKKIGDQVELADHKECYWKKGLYIGRIGRVIKERNSDGYCLIRFENTPGRNDGVEALIHNDDII